MGESLKGAFLLAEVFGNTFGLPTNPPPLSRISPAPRNGGDATELGERDEARGGGKGGRGNVGGRGGGVGGRTDIVQALELGDRDRLVKFCEAVQLLSPVNAYVRPGELRSLPPSFPPSVCPSVPSCLSNKTTTSKKKKSLIY